MSMPNQIGLTKSYIFTSGASGVQVWNGTAFVSLASASVTVLVAQVLGEWQESGLFMAVNNAGATVVKYWNGSAWATKSVV